MNRYKVDHVQFWISEHEDYTIIHFDGTSKLKTIMYWPWPAPWHKFTCGVSTPVFGAYVATRGKIIEKIEPYITAHKKVKFEGFSWGCTLAYLHADDARVYRESDGNTAPIICQLDDPPRFLKKAFIIKMNPKSIDVYYKGRSIVHHVPFAWMGYLKHLTDNYFEISTKSKWWDIRALITDHYKLKIPAVRKV